MAAKVENIGRTEAFLTKRIIVLWYVWPEVLSEVVDREEREGG